MYGTKWGHTVRGDIFCIKLKKSVYNSSIRKASCFKNVGSTLRFREKITSRKVGNFNPQERVKRT